MTKKGKDEASSELVVAALALEAELQQIEDLSEAARKLPLNSRKNLDKTAKVFSELAALDGAVGPALQALMAAIAKLGQRQAEQASALRARGDEIRQRRDTLNGLLECYQGLGERANQLKPTIQTVAETVRKGGSGETRAPVEAAHIEGVLAQMADIVSAAETLKRDAIDADFSDVAEEVDSVRQQVLAAKNRFALFATRVVPSESEDASPPAHGKTAGVTRN